MMYRVIVLTHQLYCEKCRAKQLEQELSDVKEVLDLSKGRMQRQSGVINDLISTLTLFQRDLVASTRSSELLLAKNHDLVLQVANLRHLVEVRRLQVVEFRRLAELRRLGVVETGNPEP